MKRTANFVILFSFIFILGCSGQISRDDIDSEDAIEKGANGNIPENIQTDIQTNKVKKVAPQEFKDLIEDEKVFVLDVHTPLQPQIAGTDAVIAFDKLQVQENSGRLPQDKNTPIAVYCRSGSMSAKAAETLQQMGYTNIYDLQGGRNTYVAEFGE